MKQQIVGGKSITRPISEADLQMLLKLRGPAPSAATSINVPTTSGFSPQLSTVGGTGISEPGDGQGTTITLSVSGVSGQAAHPQGHSIIFPAKGTTAPAGTFSQGVSGSTVPAGSHVITVPMSQTQVLRPATTTVTLPV